MLIHRHQMVTVGVPSISGPSVFDDGSNYQPPKRNIRLEDLVGGESTYPP